MSTSTGTIIFYDRALLTMFSSLNWTSPSTTFSIGLATTTYAPSVGSNTIYSNITGEHGTVNGYTRPGLTLSGISYTTTGSVTTSNLLGTFDFNDPYWTASGGSIVAKYYFIYTPTSVTIGSSAAVANSLIAYGLLDNTGAEVTTTNTNTLTINVSASGFFTTSIV